MKWNDFEKGQPDKSGRYLVINVNCELYELSNEDAVAIAYWNKEDHCLGKDPNNKMSYWYFIDEDLLALDEKVTHWMPLPELPDPDLKSGLE